MLTIADLTDTEFGHWLAGLIDGGRAMRLISLMCDGDRAMTGE